MKVGVVGGGIAGASAAHELAGRGAEVVLFEMESICGYHSTGRSAALFTECYGDEIVRRLAIASRGFLEEPPEGFGEDPLVGPRGVLFVSSAERRPALDAAFEEYRRLVPAVTQMPVEEAVEHCPVLDPGAVSAAILEPEAMDIDVHALHLGFQTGARHRGARILTDHTVTALSRADGGWLVDTSAGRREEADVVVDAAGAWSDVVGALAGAAPLGLTPKRRTAFTFRPPEGADHRRWPLVLDVDESWYFRPEGSRLLGSPADETPMPPSDVRHTESDVALGIERIEAATTMTIRTVETAWAGLRSFVADHRPVNGWDPGVEGLYRLAGQGGFGIKTSPAMARFAASMILDGMPPADLAAGGITPEALGPERLQASRG